MALHCELMLTTPPSPDHARERRGLEAIARASARMRRLVDDLLDAATMEKAELRIAAEPTSMSELAIEARDLFAPLALKNGVTLLLSLPAEVPLVTGDPGRIAQVFSNLLSNAIRFTPRGGEVSIAIEVLPDELAITVADTGIGIGAEDLAHVFERFWHTETTRGAGTGLGLAITLGIVSAHHGKITAKSELGRGAAFTFTIPFAAPSTLRPLRMPGASA